MKLWLVVGLCLIPYALAQSVTTGEPATQANTGVGAAAAAPISDSDPTSVDIPDDLYAQFIAKIEDLENAYDKAYHLRIGGPTAAEFVDQVVAPTPDTDTTTTDTNTQSAAQQAAEATPTSDLIKLIEQKLQTLQDHVNAPVPGAATVTTSVAADGSTQVTTTTTVPTESCPVCGTEATTGSAGTSTVTSTTKALTAADILAMAQQRAQTLIAEHYRRVGISDAVTSATGGSPTEVALTSAS